jgi:hypothetical protein
MRTPDRAPQGALVVLAAVAATAVAGVAALARAGAALCGHRVVLVHHHVPAMTMAGTVADAAPAVAGICPILLYAAGVAAALCVLAVIVLAASRDGAPAVLVAAARRIGGMQVGSLTAAIGLAGAAPLVAILATEGGLAGLPALGALASLLAGAFATALALAGAARVVLAFARRVAVALAAAFRLLAPGAGARWAVAGDPVFVPAGVRLARRRPSRAPPALR